MKRPVIAFLKHLKNPSTVRDLDAQNAVYLIALKLFSEDPFNDLQSEGRRISGAIGKNLRDLRSYILFRDALVAVGADPDIIFNQRGYVIQNRDISLNDLIMQTGSVAQIKAAYRSGLAKVDQKTLPLVRRRNIKTIEAILREQSAPMRFINYALSGGLIVDGLPQYQQRVNWALNAFADEKFNDAIHPRFGRPSTFLVTHIKDGFGIKLFAQALQEAKADTNLIFRLRGYPFSSSSIIYRGVSIDGSLVSLADYAAMTREPAIVNALIRTGLAAYDQHSHTLVRLFNGNMASARELRRLINIYPKRISKLTTKQLQTALNKRLPSGKVICDVN